MSEETVDRDDSRLAMIQGVRKWLDEFESSPDDFEHMEVNFTNDPRYGSHTLFVSMQRRSESMYTRANRLRYPKSKG
jgi:hypothetical protein